MQYLTYTDPDTGLFIREGARGGFAVKDIELTVTGFAGTEDVDWMNIDKTSINFYPDGTPSGLALTVISDTEIQLDWTAGSTNHDGHSIERSPDNITWAEIATVTGATVHYHNTGLTAGTLYYYRVRAYKGILYSNYCSSISALVPLTKRTDIVKSGGYISLGSSGNLSGGSTSRYFIMTSNKTRVRRTGSITNVKFYTANLTNIGNLYIQVWRKDGSTYDRIFQEDVLSKCVAATQNYITLTNAATAQEGDYIGIGLVSSGGTPTNVLNWSDQAVANSMYYTTNETPSETDFAWASKTSTTYAIGIEVYMSASLCVYIGDSIIAGHGLNYSFVEDGTTVDITKPINYQVSLLNSYYTYQNMGIGSQTSTSIRNRFIADCKNLKPRYAIINGGVNDISGGSITKSTFITNWTYILDTCLYNDIVPVVCKIMPWTNGTDEKMQSRDDWNTDLTTLVETYDKYILVDFDSDIGQFRVGGDSGNLWDIKAAYDADGVHLNAAGYAKAAEVIYNAITAKTITYTAYTYNAYAQGLFNAMQWPPISTDRANINTLIQALDTAGAFSYIDSLHIMAISHNTNSEALIDTILTTRSGTPTGATFNVYRGFTGDGNDYVTLQYILNGSGLYKKDDACFFIYNRANISNTTYLFAAGGSLLYLATSGSTATIRMNDSSGATVTVTSHTGFHFIQRPDSTKIQYSKNGGNLVDYTLASVAVANDVITILGRGATLPCTGEIAIVGTGKAMNQTMITAIFTAVEVYMDTYSMGVV